MSGVVVGTCGLCGGAVFQADAFLSTMPTVPRCLSCGATKKAPFGPVIEMEPAKGKQFASIGEPPSKQVMQDAVTKMQLELGNRKPSREEELIRAGFLRVPAHVDTRTSEQVQEDWEKLCRGE